MIGRLARKGKVIAVGALLVGLAGVTRFLTARPPDEVVLFAWVPSTGTEAVASGGPLNQGEPAPSLPGQSQVVVLNTRKPQEMPRVLTGGFSSACAPSVSYDGRWFLFAGKRSEADPWQIWEMRVDGSRLRQVSQGPNDLTDPCYLPDGRIAFSGAVPDQPQVRALFTCDRDGSRLRRVTFGDSYDVKPAVLPDGRILFTRIREGKPGLPMTLNPDGTGLQRFYGEAQAGGRIVSQRPPEARTYGLYEIDPSSGSVGRAVYTNPNANALDPVAAAPRPRPRALTSVVDETKKFGWLLCLDIYLSQLSEVASLKPGEVKQVQVAAVVRSNGGSSAQKEQVLGAAAVEEDGSFYLQVPADTPLRLRVLGADGRVVASCNSGVWVRPNENRGCIGCHEDPGLSPENRVPLSVTKPPVSLAHAQN